MSEVFVEIYVSKKAKVSKASVKKLVASVVKDELKKILNRKEKKNCLGFSIGLKIVSGKFIKSINKKYLKRDSFTDVITFSYMDEMKNYQINDVFHIGDVLVSYDAAFKWANEHKLHYKKELAFYIIHGILHSFGYDDSNEKNRRRMFLLQSLYMKKYKNIVDDF